jgi:hypothetical protein
MGSGSDKYHVECFVCRQALSGGAVRCGAVRFAATARPQAMAKPGEHGAGPRAIVLVGADGVGSVLQHTRRG